MTRAQRSRATNKKILEAARCTAMRDPLPMRYQWHDGNLVHRVVRDQRSFYVVVGGRRSWVTRRVYATLCDHVIALEPSGFVTSGRPPNCVHCVVGLRVARGLVIELPPWGGRTTPHVT